MFNHIHVLLFFSYKIYGKRVGQRDNGLTDENQDRLFYVLYAWNGNKINFNNITGQFFFKFKKKKIDKWKTNDSLCNFLCIFHTI